MKDVHILEGVLQFHEGGIEYEVTDTLTGEKKYLGDALSSLQGKEVRIVVTTLEAIEKARDALLAQGFDPDAVQGFGVPE